MFIYVSTHSVIIVTQITFKKSKLVFCSYYTNKIFGVSQGYELWNEWGDPFRLYPHLPFDPVLPSDAKFAGTSFFVHLKLCLSILKNTMVVVCFIKKTDEAIITFMNELLWFQVLEQGSDLLEEEQAGLARSSVRVWEAITLGSNSQQSCSPTSGTRLVNNIIK